MPQEQLENVLAEVREQHMKAAKDTKAANSMAKKQGSVGEDDANEEAVAIAGLAVAEATGAVAAGSAVAGEAEHYVAWYEDAGVSEDGGFWIHLVRSPMAWRSLLDPHLKILHRRAVPAQEAEDPVCCCH